MRRVRNTALCALLAAALLLGLCGAASAESGESAPTCTPIPVYCGGLMLARAYRVGETVYLSPEDVCRFLGLEAQTAFRQEEERSFVTVTAPGLSLNARQDADFLAVNGRYLFNPGNYITVAGRVFFPLDQMAEAFSLRCVLFDADSRLMLDISGAEILTGGPDYYEDRFGADNLLWLSRIISAEAIGQPMAGKIGVGNVVLNRVASEKYPDTIFDVVFDTMHGFQFQPVYNKTIYRPASEDSVVAACLCLEGCNTVGDSLFFVGPALADDAWFRNSLDFVIRIGDHDFYR